MRFVLLSYSLGVLLMSYAPRTLMPWEWYAVVTGVFGTCLMSRYVAHLKWRYSVLFVASVLLGMLWTNTAANKLLQNILPPAWESRDIWVQGYIDGLPTVYEQHNRFSRSKPQTVQRFDFVVYEARPAEDTDIVLPMRRLRLSWYNTDSLLKPATRWNLRVRLKRPHGFANPGGGDYAGYLLANGIHATGYVRSAKENHQLAGFDKRAYHHRIRFALRTRLEQLYKGRYQDLILALGIGDKSTLDEHKKKLLRDSGTAHLLAISGLHIGFIALLCYQLCVFLSRISERALLLLPAKCWGALGALLGATIYALLAGFVLPTRRALIMVIIVMLAVLWRRSLSFSAGFCVALAIVLSMQPLAGHTVGFWLSFIAVAALLVALRGSGDDQSSSQAMAADSRIRRFIDSALQRSKLWVLQLLHAQYAVSIALLVPLGIFFHAIPVFSFVANLLAIPLVSVAVVPLVLGGLLLLGVFPGLATFVLALAEKILDFLLSVLSFILSVSPDANVWYPPAWSTWMIVIALLGGGLSLYLKTWRYRLLALLLLLPLFWQSSITRDTLRVEVLDVGQGLSVLIQTAQHAMLYDAGPKYNRSDAGKLVVIPAMRYRGIKELDLLLLSHRDTDHIGGARSVLEQVLVRRTLISSSHSANSAYKAQLFSDADTCHGGQSWHWDGVDFEILHPPADFDQPVENNRSCVLLVRYKDHSVLIGGDIDKATEHTLLPRLTHGKNLSALFASHHGSRTSSSALWVRSLKPRYVFYSAGYRNQFGHPHSSVEERFAKAGSHAFNTASQGAILLRVDAHGQMIVNTWRDQNPRFWY